MAKQKRQSMNETDTSQAPTLARHVAPSKGKIGKAKERQEKGNEKVTTERVVTSHIFYSCAPTLPPDTLLATVAPSMSQLLT